MRNFLPFLSGGLAPGAAPAVSAALAAMTERANAAVAKGEQAAAELATATANLAALTTERDALQASLTEAAANLATAETALAEKSAAFTALETEMPEKVKAAAVLLAAGSGVTPREVPPVVSGGPGSGSGSGKAAMDAATNPHEYGRAVQAALGLTVRR